jgi:hypothetical protein
MSVVEAPNTASNNSDDDHHVRMAVLACVSFWQQQQHSNASRFEQDASCWCGSHYHIHTNCSVMDIHVPQDGITTTGNDDTTTTTTSTTNTVTSYTTTSGSTYQLSPTDAFQIVSIRILKSSIHSHHSSSLWNAPQAAAVQIVSSPQRQQQQSSSSSSVVGGVPTTAGWMVLLRNCTHQWQCISGAFVVMGVPTTSTTTLRIPRSVVVTPFDFQQVMSCVWDGYCMANRMCDGTAMQ